MNDELFFLFDTISFDADHHRYTHAPTGQPLISVSRAVKHVTPEFEAERIAAKVAAKNGKTTDEVLAEWEDKKVVALQRGTLVHDYIEATLQKRTPPANPFCPNGQLPEMEAFDSWYTSAVREGAHLVATEMIIGDVELGIAGTLDCLLFSEKTGKHHLLDWKTNSKFRTSNRWQTLLPPFAHVGDCELGRYSLQLSLYRLILERTAGHLLELGDSFLVHLSRDGRPWTYRAIDLRERAEEWLMTQPLQAAAYPT